MSFAKRLRFVMEERQISQTELANAIGKGKSSISQYLSGKNIPKEKVQEKIAEALDCTVEYLNDETVEVRSSNGLLKIPISLAAMMLDKSDQFVRVALQSGTAPFGFASKTKTKWSYHISPKRLKEYVGEEVYNQFVQMKSAP